MRTCWQRCIADLSGVRLDLVPDFVGEDPTYWLANTGQWLSGHGWNMVCMVSVETGGPAIELAKLATAHHNRIEVGTTASGAYHAVVRQADGTVWDPQPSCGQLVTIMGIYWLVR